jgi:hypothetical protein
MTNVIDLNEPHLKREEMIQAGHGGVQASRARTSVGPMIML